MTLATNIIGQADTITYGDTNAAGAGQFFYRVGSIRPDAASGRFAPYEFANPGLTNRAGAVTLFAVRLPR